MMTDLKEVYIAFAVGFSCLLLIAVFYLISNLKKKKIKETHLLLPKFNEFKAQVHKVIVDMSTKGSYKLTSEEMNVTWTGIFPMDQKRSGESEIEFFLRVAFNRKLTTEQIINNDWDDKEDWDECCISQPKLLTTEQIINNNWGKEEDWDKCCNSQPKVLTTEQIVNNNCEEEEDWNKCCNSQPKVMTPGLAYDIYKETQHLIHPVEDFCKNVDMKDFILNKLEKEHGHIIWDKTEEEDESIDWMTVCAEEKERTQKLYNDISKGVVQSAQTDFESGIWLIQGKYYPQSVLFFQQAMEKILKSIVLQTSSQQTFYDLKHEHSLSKLMKYIPEEMKQIAPVADIGNKMESLGRSPEFTRKYQSLCV